MVLGKNQRPASLRQALDVALEDGPAGLLGLYLQMPDGDRQVRAGRQAHQIDRVGKPVCFVEIVDAPDQAAFDVAPGAEILDVEVAHGEHLRRAGDIRADFRPQLHPAVEGGAQEGK